MDKEKLKEQITKWNCKPSYILTELNELGKGEYMTKRQVNKYKPQHKCENCKEKGSYVLKGSNELVGLCFNCLLESMKKRAKEMKPISKLKAEKVNSEPIDIDEEIKIAGEI